MQGFVEIALSPVYGGIENLEELNQPLPHIAAVFLGSLCNQIVEDVPRLEDAGIVGEKAEEQTYKNAFKVMPNVSGFFQSVV